MVRMKFEDWVRLERDMKLSPTAREFENWNGIKTRGKTCNRLNRFSDKYGDAFYTMWDEAFNILYIDLKILAGAAPAFGENA